MKRLSIMTIITLVLITQGCSNQAESLPEPEATIQVQNDSTLQFNRVEMKLYQEDHFVAGQNGMYADGSIISNGDTLRFEYFEEDPIKFNAETKIELTLYNDKQIVDQRNYNINFNQSKEINLEIKDEG